MKSTVALRFVSRANDLIWLDEAGLALDSCRFDPLEKEMRPRQAIGGGSHQNGPRLGQITQPGSQIDGVAGDFTTNPVGVQAPDHYHPAVDPGMHGQRVPDAGFIRRADCLNRPVNFPGRADRPHRIVFMAARHTEEDHRCIPQEAADEAVILPYNPGDFRENPAHDLLDLFRVQPLGHPGITVQIGEHDRDPFALPGDDRQCVMVRLGCQ